MPHISTFFYDHESHFPQDCVDENTFKSKLCVFCLAFSWHKNNKKKHNKAWNNYRREERIINLTSVAMRSWGSMKIASGNKAEMKASKQKIVAMLSVELIQLRRENYCWIEILLRERHLI